MNTAALHEAIFAFSQEIEELESKIDSTAQACYTLSALIAENEGKNDQLAKAYHASHDYAREALDDLIERKCSAKEIKGSLELYLYNFE